MKHAVTNYAWFFIMNLQYNDQSALLAMRPEKQEKWRAFTRRAALSGPPAVVNEEWSVGWDQAERRMACSA
jgi:hypothetical protein